jgi:hypothetical protein
MYFSLCDYRMHFDSGGRSSCEASYFQPSGMKAGQQRQQEKDQYARCQREREHLGDRARKHMRPVGVSSGSPLQGCSCVHDFQPITPVPAAPAIRNNANFEIEIAPADGISAAKLV